MTIEARRRRFRRAIIRHHAAALAAHLGECICYGGVEGYTPEQLARAQEKIDAIAAGGNPLENWCEALENRHAYAFLTGVVSIDLPSWLQWAIKVITDAVKFIIEHPALVKFLLSILLSLMDEQGKAIVMPSPAG